MEQTSDRAVYWATNVLKFDNDLDISNVKIKFLKGKEL